MVQMHFLPQNQFYSSEEVVEGWKEECCSTWYCGDGLTGQRKHVPLKMYLSKGIGFNCSPKLSRLQSKRLFLGERVKWHVTAELLSWIFFSIVEDAEEDFLNHVAQLLEVAQWLGLVLARHLPFRPILTHSPCSNAMAPMWLPLHSVTLVLQGMLIGSLPPMLLSPFQLTWLACLLYTTPCNYIPARYIPARSPYSW